MSWICEPCVDVIDSLAGRKITAIVETSTGLVMTHHCEHTEHSLPIPDGAKVFGSIGCLMHWMERYCLMLKGNWNPDKDFTSPEEAASRVNFLNGGK